VEWGDDPAGPEAHLGGEVDEPDDTADIYRGLAAERAAIMTDFARRLASAPKSAKRAIKEARGAALAAAKRRAKSAASGRRRLAKEKRPSRPPKRAIGQRAP
jgi:hypothetical protein